LTFIGTWVTEKIVEPRLGTYKGDYKEKGLEGLSKVEKKGIIYSAVATAIALILALLLVLPPIAPLRGTEGNWLDQIIQSPF
ncbi:aminobenzoyl-glutamate transporter, partial [Salmonella enterica subsp. enterica serovar Typhimurium]|uniref:AbgT family transporter n=1 Tax=Salmonella enterica TaxID=28901 RepID=UPI000CC5FA1B